MIFLVIPFSVGISYVRANQQLIAKIHDDGSVDYYQLDAFNNVRSMFNDIVCLKEIQDYLPFGRGAFKSLEHIQYNTGFREWTTDLYGPYSTISGRFITPIDVSTLANPQTLNNYIYKLNNPFRKIPIEVPDLYKASQNFEAPSGAKSLGSVSGAMPIFTKTNTFIRGGTASINPQAYVAPIAKVSSSILIFMGGEAIKNQPAEIKTVTAASGVELVQDVADPQQLTDAQVMENAYQLAENNPELAALISIKNEYGDLVSPADPLTAIRESDFWRFSVHPGETFNLVDADGNEFVWQVCAWEPGEGC